MSTLKRSLEIAGVFTAMILGAGFASGQELMSFFVVYGRAGFLGIAAAAVLFGLTGWAVLDLRLTLGVKNYGEFSRRVLGGLGPVMETVVACFLFVLFSTMLAASGSALGEGFGLDRVWGAGIMSGLCFILFAGGLDRVVRFSAVLAPVMVIGGVVVGVVLFAAAPVFAQISPRNWYVSAAVYASYNMITAVTVLADMDGVTRKAAFWGPVLGALAIAALGVCMSLPLFASFAALDGVELPLLRLASGNGRFIRLAYIFVLLAAIATTAAANGYAFAEWLGRTFRVSPPAARAGVCVCGLFAARIGFSNFVARVYPLFGIVGLVQIVVILAAHWRRLFCRRGKELKKH